MAGKSEKKSDRPKNIQYYKNQLHNPKYTAPDDSRPVGFYVKDHNSTMRLGVLTGLAATSLAMYIENYFKKHNSKLEVGFVFPKNVKRT